MTEFKNPIKELHQEFHSSSDINSRTSVFKLWLEAIVKFNLSVHVGWLMKNRRDNVPDNIKVQLVNLFQKPPSIGVCLSLSRLINRIIPASESIHGRMTEFRALFEASDSLFSELLEIRNAEAHSTRPITSFDLDRIQDYMNRISYNPFYALEVIPIQVNEYVEAREVSMFANLNPTTFDNRKLPVLAGSGNYKPGNLMGEDDIVLFPVAVFDEKDALYLWNQRSGSNGKYSTYSKKSDSVVVNNITDISGFPYDDWKRSANPIYVKYLEVRSKALDDLPANKDISIREVFNELNLAKRLEDDAQIREYERISEFQFLSIIYSRIEEIADASEKVYFLSFIVERIEEYKTDVIDDFRRLRELQLRSLLLLIKVEIDKKSYNRASDLSIFFIKKYIELTKSFYNQYNYSTFISLFRTISAKYYENNFNSFLRRIDFFSIWFSFLFVLIAVYNLIMGDTTIGIVSIVVSVPFLIYYLIRWRFAYPVFNNKLKLRDIGFHSVYGFKPFHVFRYILTYLNQGANLGNNYGLFTLISFAPESLNGSLIRTGFLLYAPELIRREFADGFDKGVDNILEFENKILSATDGDDLEFVLALRLKVVLHLIEHNYYQDASALADLSHYYRRMMMAKARDQQSAEYINISRVLMLEYQDDRFFDRLFVVGSLNDLLYSESLMYMWKFVQAESNEKSEYINSSRNALRDKTYRNTKTPPARFVDGNFAMPITASQESRLRYLRGFWLANIGEFEEAVNEYRLVYQKSEDGRDCSSLWNIVSIRCGQQNEVEFDKSFALLKQVIRDIDPDLKNKLHKLLDSVSEIEHAIKDSGGKMPQHITGVIFAPSQVWKKVSEVHELKANT